jgi:NAD(P)H dehydrogenase (quinone)
MLLVSGANGNLARAVIANLLEMVEPAQVAVFTRTPDTPYAAGLRQRGVDVRHGDFDAPETLPGAFAGVRRALLISTYADNDVRLGQNRAAIDAARAAGVEHLAYTSFLAAGPDALAEHSQLVHYPTEQALAASGLAYTVLRHALYAEILVGDLDETLASGVLRRCGGAAACTYIARGDLGRSAATILAGEGHENRIYNETMAQAYTGDEVAAAIARCFGTPVRYEPVPAADWPAYMISRWGVPEVAARSTVGTMRAIEAGQFDLVTDDYRHITGRLPQSLDEFLAQVKQARSGVQQG